MNSRSPSSRTLTGGLLIIGSMSIIGFVDNLVPIIAKDFGVWQFHAIRSALAVPVVVILLRVKGRTPFPKDFGKVAVRSILIASSMLLYFGSLALMPIAEAGAALFSSPIFVLIFSVVLFRTPVGIWRIFAIALGFCGVLLVLKPDFANLDAAVIFPIAASVLYGLGQLVTRHWCSNEDTLVVLLGFFVAIGCGGAIGLAAFTFAPIPEAWDQAGPFFVRGWQPPTWEFALWTCIQAFGSLVAVGGIVKGYQIAEPTLVGVFEYSFLLFAGFWGWAIWRVLPDSLALAGIAAIVLAGIVITVRSRF